MMVELIEESIEEMARWFEMSVAVYERDEVEDEYKYRIREAISHEEDN